MTQRPHVKNVIAVNTTAIIETTKAAVPSPDLDFLSPTHDKTKPVIDIGKPQIANHGTTNPTKALMIPRMPKTKPAIFKPFPISILLSLELTINKKKKKDKHSKVKSANNTMC